MSHISESIPDLLGGVSQLAPQRRAANEVESMVNCQLRPAESVTKRPPTKWVAEVAATSAAYTGAFVHPINKNASERFWVIVLDGDLKVFNATTGAEVTVTFPDGKAYLDVVGSPNEKFRLATFGDSTVIVNRETVIDQNAELSSSRGREAFISVNQTDWNVLYTISVTFSGAADLTQTPSRIADYKIGNPSDGGEILDTTVVANALASEINTSFLGVNGLNQLWAVVIGSGIYITTLPGLADGFDFTITVTDGLGGQGMTLLQGSVQSTQELPAIAPVGFIIKIEGNAEKTLDDVYYEFTESGAWKERTQDNIPVALDPTTLPLELVSNPDFTTEDTDAQAPMALTIPGPLVPFTAALLETADGSASTAGTQQVSPSPGTTESKFYNMASASGGTAVFVFDAKFDATKLVGAGVNPKDPSGVFINGDRFDWEVAYDVGAGFVVAETEPITNWNAATFRITARIPIPLAVAGTDIRVSLISDAANLGAVSMTPKLVGAYDVPLSSRLSFPTAYYAPNTVLSATLNGTAWTHTFTAGGTRAALLAELKTDLEAYGGAKAITATIAEDAFSGSIDITNDDGTEPTFTSFVFDDALDLATQLFNGSVDFTTLGLASGDIVSNTTDSSAAVVSTIAATIVTHSTLAGGVANVWANADGVSITKTTTEFICRQPEWAKRLVGTLETNKWPSFTGGTLNEVAFLKNRLVLLSDENVTMSEVDGFFNFFRSSTIDVLDGDRIDVALSGNKASALHSAFTWNETLLTWSELGQFVVNGEPFLSPNTVKREATTSYLNTRKVKPVTSERAVYFLTEGTEFCQLWDYRPTAEDATSAEGNRLSVKTPRYMPGTPRGLLAVSDPEIVLVLTATDPEKLYVYSHLLQDQQRVMGSWHEWTFPGVTQILGMGSIDNEVSLIFVRDDGKVHLEVIDLWELSETTVDSQTTNGDPATPPVYNPTSLTTRTSDTVTEASDAKISDHTASPTSAGAWLVDPTYDVIAGTGYYISGNQFRASNIIASTVPPFRVDFNDPYLAGGGSDFHTYMEASWSLGGHLVAAELQCHLLASPTDKESGLRLRVTDIDATSVKILLEAIATGGGTNSTEFPTTDAVSGTITVTASRSHAGGDITAKQRYGIRVTDDTVVVYAADEGGANEVTLYTGTLVALWKAKYRGGTYSYHGARVTASVFRTAQLDNYFFASGAATPGTAYTTPLGDAAFTTVVGVETDGTETTLTNNGDGTVTFPTDDKTGVDIVVGLPVASTIELTQLYHRKNFGPLAGSAEVRGATYINSLLVGLEDTSTMAIAIAITGHDSFSQDLTELRSLDGEYMHCRVGGRNTETTITLTSADATNFKIVGIDWEGIYYNRTRRMS